MRFALLHATGSVMLFIATATSWRISAIISDRRWRVAAPEGFPGALATLGGPVRDRSSHRPVAVADTLARGRCRSDRGTGSLLLPKALQDRGRDRRRPRGASARRRGDGALPRLARRAGARQPDRDRRGDARSRRSGAPRTRLRDICFDTIAGAARTAPSCITASPRRPMRASRTGSCCWSIPAGSIVDGTTDITRTVADRRGRRGGARRLHPRAAGHDRHQPRLRWPKGLAGRDSTRSRARPSGRPGSDYDHGTGHGVGGYLWCTRGRSGSRAAPSVPLEPGMILSNEPGYYREGAFGIRIENLIVVQPARRRCPAAPSRHDARLRDADLRADRPAADRARDADEPRSATG